MPIQISKYDWKQNNKLIFIQIKLVNQCNKKVDIVCTSTFIKVTYNCYICEIFLRKRIDPDKFSYQVLDEVLHLQLQKEIEEEWDTLNVLNINKKEKVKLRSKALQEYEANQQQKQKKENETLRSLEHMAISKQICINDQKREEFNNKIQEEQINFFQSTSNSQSQNYSENKKRTVSVCSTDSQVLSENGYEGDIDSNVVSSSVENHSGSPQQKWELKIEKSSKTKSLQKVRTPHTFKISHSKHDSGMSKRETFCDTKNEKLENNASEEKVLEDEVEIQLKNEARDAFSDKNYEKAVRVYASLINSYPNHASYYSNRAAAYLLLNRNKKVVEDCTKALELLDSAADNKKSQLLCHIRRGTAYVRLQDHKSGLEDYRIALSLDPNNESVAKDLQNIKNYISDSDTLE